jgi:hypothetical protein
MVELPSGSASVTGSMGEVTVRPVLGAVSGRHRIAWHATAGGRYTVIPA